MWSVIMTHYALMLIVQSFATLSQKVLPLVAIPTLKLSLSPGNLYLNSAGFFGWTQFQLFYSLLSTNFWFKANIKSLLFSDLSCFGFSFLSAEIIFKHTTLWLCFPLNFCKELFLQFSNWILKLSESKYFEVLWNTSGIMSSRHKADNSHPRTPFENETDDKNNQTGIKTEFVQGQTPVEPITNPIKKTQQSPLKI